MIEYQDLMDQAGTLFKARFSVAPEIRVAAPGRANLIGEHTDYNDGHVLPIAIDRFTVAAAAHRSDRRFRLYAANLDEAFEFDLDDLPEERPGWASYMLGVAAEMERDGFTLSGKDILVLGNVPLGSGISSSAALEISTATVLERLEGLKLDDGRMVQICRKADHHFVGVKSGPMDQYASRACRKGHAGLLDCRALEMTHHRLPDGVAFLSIYSGMPRALVASEYNERQESCQKAVEVLKAVHPEINALRDADPELVQSVRPQMGDRVFRRARHVVTEQTRVFDFIKSLNADNLDRVGEILHEGHRSLAEDFEVSLPVLDAMVDWLSKQTGVVGTRLTGAGFGGSLICLIRQDSADTASITGSFVQRFQRETQEPPQIWQLTSVDGAGYQPSF